MVAFLLSQGSKVTRGTCRRSGHRRNELVPKPGHAVLRAGLQEKMGPTVDGSQQPLVVTWGRGGVPAGAVEGSRM